MKQKTITIVEEATTGLKMPEKSAQLIAELSNGLPAECKYHRKACTALMEDVAGDDRSEVSIISSDSVDRDRECVMPGGGDWSRYNKGVYLNHDYNQFVGACKWIAHRDGGRKLGAKTHYPTKPDDWGDVAWLPSMVRHFQRQETPTLTGKSIGFLPLKIRAATKEEKSIRPELDGVPMIEKWAGLEYSVVGIPCNPDAEMVGIAKALKSGDCDEQTAELLVKMYGKTMIDLPMIREDIVNADVIDETESCPACSKSGVRISANGEAYSCPSCGHAWSDGKVAATVAVTTPQPSPAPVQQATVFVATPAKAFVRPETIKAALDRRMKGEVAGMDIAGQVEHAMYERLMLLLGRA